MIKKGLKDEAESLLKFRNLPALNTMGYKELFSYFDGKIKFEDAINEIKKNTRRYAKRQITWFKKYDNALSFSVESPAEGLYDSLKNQ